jgi:hypothetical protein
VTYVRAERDWLERAQRDGRLIDSGRLLPMLPAGVSGNGHAGNGQMGNGHSGNGHPADSHSAGGPDAHAH